MQEHVVILEYALKKLLDPLLGRIIELRIKEDKSENEWWRELRAYDKRMVETGHGEWQILKNKREESGLKGLDFQARAKILSWAFESWTKKTVENMLTVYKKETGQEWVVSKEYISHLKKVLTYRNELKSHENEIDSEKYVDTKLIEGFHVLLAIAYPFDKLFVDECRELTNYIQKYLRIGVPQPIKRVAEILQCTEETIRIVCAKDPKKFVIIEDNIQYSSFEELTEAVLDYLEACSQKPDSQQPADSTNQVEEVTKKQEMLIPPSVSIHGQVVDTNLNAEGADTTNKQSYSQDNSAIDTADSEDKNQKKRQPIAMWVAGSAAVLLLLLCFSLYLLLSRHNLANSELEPQNSGSNISTSQELTSADDIPGKPESPPTSSITVESTPSDTALPESPPADATSPELPLQDTTPPESPPADTTPPESLPSDTAPPDSTPSNASPPGTTPSDTAPPESTPSNASPVNSVNEIVSIAEKRGFDGCLIVEKGKQTRPHLMGSLKSSSEYVAKPVQGGEYVEGLALGVAVVERTWMGVQYYYLLLVVDSMAEFSDLNSVMSNLICIEVGNSRTVNGISPSFSYYSSDESVVTLGENNILKAHSSGIAIIKGAGVASNMPAIYCIVYDFDELDK